MNVQPNAAAQASAAAAAGVPANPTSEMGQQTFLKLLVAELKHQDPMDPMQGRDMVAQLAQLSSVEKLTGIDTKLGQLQTGNAANAGLQSAGLIGRKATGDTSRLVLTDTTNPTGNYQILGKADSVVVKVRDAAGNVVLTAPGASGTGSKPFLWNGKLDNNNRAPNGTYSFEVTATNNGIPVPTTTAVSGLVTEVTYENGAPQVVVGGARIPLGDVTSIAQ